MTPDDLERRITELEIKASYAEDLLDQLNQTIFRQQRQIEQMARDLSGLRDQVSDIGPTGQTSLRDQLPPHY